jgi:hypothetical protein
LNYRVLLDSFENTPKKALLGAGKKSPAGKGQKEQLWRRGLGSHTDLY